MNVELKRIAAFTLAALGVSTAGVALAADPDGTEAVPARHHVFQVPRHTSYGSRHEIGRSDQLIPRYVDGTPENILALPFDLAKLEATVKLAAHPAAQGYPEAPPVPYNPDTGYLGAPLIDSHG